MWNRRGKEPDSALAGSPWFPRQRRQVVELSPAPPPVPVPATTRTRRPSPAGERDRNGGVNRPWYHSPRASDSIGRFVRGFIRPGLLDRIDPPRANPKQTQTRSILSDHPSLSIEASSPPIGGSIHPSPPSGRLRAAMRRVRAARRASAVSRELDPGSAGSAPWTLRAPR